MVDRDPSAPAFRRSPTTGSSRTATPAPSSRPTARSSGCACRASTRRASSARCSTAAPAGSGSARTRRSRSRAATSPGPTSSRPPGRPRPAGWSSATRSRSVRGGRAPTTRTPARRPTSTPSASLVRVATCVQGEVEIELTCHPRFDYGRAAPEWELADDRHSRARPTAEGQPDAGPDAPTSTSGSRSSGVEARHLLSDGESCFCALAWGADPMPPEHGRRRARRGSTATAEYWRRWLANGELPRPPVADPPAALGAGPQGAHLRAHRGAGRRADHLAARDAGRRAQLGLPLHLDPRRDLHALGAARARPRRRGRRLRPLHRRHLPRARQPAADHVRDRRRARADRERPSTTSPATAARSRCGSATAPSTSTRTTSTGRSSTRSTSTPSADRAIPAAGLADRRRPGRGARRRSGRSPTRGSGRRAAPAKHYVSSKLMCWVARRPRRPARRAPRASEDGAADALARDRRARSSADILERGVTDGACCASTTTPTRSTPRSCSRRWSASCPPTTR